MTTGRVDKSWAIQHHDLWYEELKRAEAGPSGPADQLPSEITGVAPWTARHRTPKEPDYAEPLL
jgi:hypothetical protein